MVTGLSEATMWQQMGEAYLESSQRSQSWTESQVCSFAQAQGFWSLKNQFSSQSQHHQDVTANGTDHEGQQVSSTPSPRTPRHLPIGALLPRGQRMGLYFCLNDTVVLWSVLLSLFSKNHISALGPTLNSILTQSHPSYYFFPAVLLDSCIPLSNQLPLGDYLWLICPKIVSLLSDMQEF